MKYLIAIIMGMFLVGCQHGVPCPKDLGKPGDTCSVLIIPTPGDALSNSMEIVAMARTVFGNEGRLETKEP